MTVLITGVAGFIGSHTASALLDRGEMVVGIDNMNDYYDVTLKESRLARIEGRKGFSFAKIDIADRDAVQAVLKQHPAIDRVIHLAAQAGVRYSLVNPYAYLRSNIDGHVVLLESCRELAQMKHFVYASSSSVYGANTDLPFSVDDRVDRPVSLYGATKKAMEGISHAYAHIYGIPQTGLRFFTVYGPWGRPDMSAFISPARSWPVSRSRFSIAATCIETSRTSTTSSPASSRVSTGRRRPSTAPRPTTSTTSEIIAPRR